MFFQTMLHFILVEEACILEPLLSLNSTSSNKRLFINLVIQSESKDNKIVPHNPINNFHFYSSFREPYAVLLLVQSVCASLGRCRQ